MPQWHFGLVVFGESGLRKVGWYGISPLNAALKQQRCNNLLNPHRNICGKNTRYLCSSEASSNTSPNLEEIFWEAVGLRVWVVLCYFSHKQSNEERWNKFQHDDIFRRYFSAQYDEFSLDLRVKSEDDNKRSKARHHPTDKKHPNSG